MARSSPFDSPLKGRAPSLQPTARPLDLRIGATAPSSRSGVMELANSFNGFNDQLRGLLRDVSAREEQDAHALGELKASELQAAGRLQELDGELKKLVDSGVVSKVRLPAFQRGFSARTGRDLAASAFQSELIAQLPDTMKVDGRLDPEEAIGKTYQKYAEKLGGLDLDARASFDQTAQGVIAGFRQRSAEGYTAAYEAAGEQRMADEGAALLLDFAMAPADELTEGAAPLQNYLTQIRTEMPKRDANTFFVSKVADPVVDNLISQGKYDEARNLLSDLTDLVVDGKNGTLGKTANGQLVIARLRNQLDRAEREQGPDRELRALQAKRQKADEFADADVADFIQKAKAGGTFDLSNAARNQAINDYSSRFANSVEDRQRARSFSERLTSAFEAERKGTYDAQAEAQLQLEAQTLRKADIDILRAKVNVLSSSYQIRPDVAAELTDRLNKQEALYGHISERDISSFNRSAFPRDTTTGTVVLNLPGVSEADMVLWDGKPEVRDKKKRIISEAVVGLTAEQKDEYQLRAAKLYQNALEDEIAKIGDPNKVPAEKFVASERAAQTVSKQASALLREISGASAKKAEVIKKTEDAKAVSTAKAVVRQSPFSYEYEDTVPVGRTGQKQKVKKTFSPDDADDTSKIQDDYKLPRSERDFIRLRPERSGIAVLKGNSQNIYSLPEIAKELTNPETSPALRSKQQEFYGYAKASLGFTPDEIKKGETKHGVGFDAAQIDPSVIRVFRTKEELETFWNAGEPTPEFEALRNSVLQTKDADAFYRAQLALF